MMFGAVYNRFGKIISFFSTIVNQILLRWNRNTGSSREQSKKMCIPGTVAAEIPNRQIPPDDAATTLLTTLRNTNMRATAGFMSRILLKDWTRIITALVILLVARYWIADDKCARHSVVKFEDGLQECREACMPAHISQGVVDSVVTVNFSGLLWRVVRNDFEGAPLVSSRHVWVDKTGSLRIKMDRCVGAHLYTVDLFWFGFYRFSIAGGVDDTFHPTAAELSFSLAEDNNVTIRFESDRRPRKPTFGMEYLVSDEKISEFHADDFLLTEYHILRTPTKIAFRSFQGHGRPFVFRDQDASVFAPEDGRRRIPQTEMPVHIRLVAGNATDCDADAGMVEVVIRAFRYESL
ncbi:uncharacterized protein LOC129594828 isoform X2 [Paramacrobiotus metropolitanus]|uniref:uncharacterized protein LOC129594828 isoform X2 n=1 Tax=Paramacrobiotus metropolitanus TaxID=2943436 RepID=UPI0024458712|nr:uncharacterized protein LOC129594828 isoform X2 [Paramacrobiotus metropolitanus]